jgi:Gas vesicle protein G
MFVLDSLLISGIRFVLENIATVADAELNDPDRQRDRLLEAQMKLESGEIDEAQFNDIEADVFERLREIRARTQPQQTIVDDEHRVAGVEITVDDDAES